MSEAHPISEVGTDLLSLHTPGQGACTAQQRANPDDTGSTPLAVSVDASRWPSESPRLSPSQEHHLSRLLVTSLSDQSEGSNSVPLETGK